MPCEYRIEGDVSVKVTYKKEYTNRGHYYYDRETKQCVEHCVYCGEKNPWLWEFRGKKGIVQRRKEDCRENQGTIEGT